LRSTRENSSHGANHQRSVPEFRDHPQHFAAGTPLVAEQRSGPLDRAEFKLVFGKRDELRFGNL